ncbi:MAG TPA: AzlC family ABC transporter permease [Afifellaceae bacterium]|nr:AzlC family ABC transporter permease [Afifellaceae bacterium]
MPSPASPQPAPSPAPRAEFLRGARDIVPIVAAASPFGIVFGALAVQKGLSFAEAMAMSAIIYAGASQFAALELWAPPLPVWAILFSVLAVNFRHVLYSAALGRRMRHWPAAGRLAGFGLMVDPIYALAELNGGARLSGAYYAGIALPLYFAWVAATAVGAAFGNLITDPVALGLDFVLTAYFLILVLGFRARPNAGWIIVTAAVGSIAAYLTIGPPWHIGAGAFAGIGIAAALAGRRMAS